MLYPLIELILNLVKYCVFDYSAVVEMSLCDLPSPRLCVELMRCKAQRKILLAVVNNSSDAAGGSITFAFTCSGSNLSFASLNA
jgi:hypothetical protein